MSPLPSALSPNHSGPSSALFHGPPEVPSVLSPRRPSALSPGGASRPSVLSPGEASRPSSLSYGGASRPSSLSPGGAPGPSALSPDPSSLKPALSPGKSGLGPLPPLFYIGIVALLGGSRGTLVPLLAPVLLKGNLPSLRGYLALSELLTLSLSMTSLTLALIVLLCDLEILSLLSKSRGGRARVLPLSAPGTTLLTLSLVLYLLLMLSLYLSLYLSLHLA